MENYGLIIQLLATFNALNKGIGNTPMYTYEMKGKDLVIDSYCPTNLSGLFTVLWGTTKDFIFFLEDNKILVKNIKPVY